MASYHEADLVIGGTGCYFLCAVEDLGHGPLHVGLARAEPDITKEDIIQCERGGYSISYDNVASRTRHLVLKQM